MSGTPDTPGPPDELETPAAAPACDSARSCVFLVRSLPFDPALTVGSRGLFTQRSSIAVQQEALVCHIEMDDAVLDRSRELVREVASCHDTVEDRTFLELASTYAQDLPRALRQPLNRFRLAEPASLCVVSGWPVDDDRIGPTPTHWESKPVPSPALEEEIFFFLCGSLLGDPLGWATQQDGYVMHALRPYLRLDPYFMERPRDDEARHALDTLVAAIDRELTGVALRPGELCFIDNFKAVHGRQPFHASYDGRDRWMKRLNIVRDVRKSRDARQQAASRIIV